MFEILENDPDDVRIRDVGDDPQRPATAWTRRDVDFEYAFQALCPRQRGSGLRLIVGGFKRLTLMYQKRGVY